MPYTPRSRDRFKNLVALLTGAATFTSVAAAGAATGQAAHDTALRDQQRAQEHARADAAARAASLETARQEADSAVTTSRPQRTVVHTRVVHRVSKGGVAAVGPGGTVGRTTYTSPPAGSHVRQPPPPPPNPAAPPPPAPSSGS